MSPAAQWSLVRQVLVEERSIDPDLALELVRQYIADRDALPGEDLRLVEDAIDIVARRVDRRQA